MAPENRGITHRHLSLFDELIMFPEASHDLRTIDDRTAGSALRTVAVIGAAGHTRSLYTQPKRDPSRPSSDTLGE